MSNERRDNMTEQDAMDRLGRMWGDVPEVMQEYFRRIPYGQRITLANGRTGSFVKFFEPDAGDNGMKFGVDFRFDDGGSPDHFEFVTRHTGGGGAI